MKGKQLRAGLGNNEHSNLVICARQTLYNLSQGRNGLQVTKNLDKEEKIKSKSKSNESCTANDKLLLCVFY